jgi:hypothetical protein
MRFGCSSYFLIVEIPLPDWVARVVHVQVSDEVNDPDSTGDLQCVTANELGIPMVQRSR